jgi:hypothetical protein
VGVAEEASALMGRLDRLDVYRDEDWADAWPPNRYTDELPDKLVRALADAPIVPEHRLSKNRENGVVARNPRRRAA